MLTERDIQLRLYRYRRSISAFPLMVPNVYLWSWESDLLYVSDLNYVTEYEIKISHSDFLADAKKDKFFLLNPRSDARIFSRFQGGKRRDYDGPTYFYYVCPSGVIDIGEVPKFAGLIYIPEPDDNCFLLIEKSAPRRRGEALTDNELRYLLKKGVSRYWRSQMTQQAEVGT